MSLVLGTQFGDEQPATLYPLRCPEGDARPKTTVCADLNPCACLDQWLDVMGGVHCATTGTATDAERLETLGGVLCLVGLGVVVVGVWGRTVVAFRTGVDSFWN
jgi:hypothetical protein